MTIITLVIVVVVLAGIVIAFFGWDRYGRGRNSVGSSAAQRTEEVFIDPDSGQKMRVWYDPGTGQREYRPEEPG